MKIINLKYIKILNKIFKKNIFFIDIINELKLNNGKVYLVGGFLRDLFIYKKYILKNNKIMDFDLEVHNLSFREVEKILSKFGEVEQKGKDYGVLNIKGINIDFTFPRIDGTGRKPKVELKNIKIEKSLIRRDFTMNSMALELPLKKINYLIDPFNGYKDIKNKKIRATNLNFFADDPLRFFRLIRYSVLFNMKIDKDLKNICKKMNISNISIERKENEFKKIFIYSDNYYDFINIIHKLKRLKEVSSSLFYLKNNFYKKKFNLFLKILKFSKKIKNDKYFKENRFFYLISRFGLIIKKNNFDSIKIIFDLFGISIKKYLNRIVFINNNFEKLLKLSKIKFKTKEKEIFEYRKWAYKLYKNNLLFKDIYFIFEGYKKESKIIKNKAEKYYLFDKFLKFKEYKNLNINNDIKNKKKLYLRLYLNFIKNN